MTEPLGILLYGYSEADAKNIGEAIGQLAGAEVILMSAGDRDDAVVSQILELGPAENTFAESEAKVCMFLGFPDDLLQSVMKGFPNDVTRPIFCGLTENNYNWTMKYLVEHLLEERAYWKSRKGGTGQ